MHQFFTSPFYNFELTRILGTAGAGGCDVAEFLEAVGEIKKHDPESWYRAWWKQACRASQAATDASRHGLAPLAKAAYLRASNYYRAAPYMLPNFDRRILKCSELSAEHFEKATQFMEGKVLSLEFRFNDINFSGRLFLPPETKRLGNEQKTPLLVNCGGADSTMEELYFVFGTLGPELGYAVLNFDGPGQGLTLKRDGKPMRPDYEKVLACVLDRIWALDKDRPDCNLDLNRVCVAGISMGGYIALRTAAAERDGMNQNQDFIRVWVRHEPVGDNNHFPRRALGLYDGALPFEMIRNINVAHHSVIRNWNDGGDGYRTLMKTAMVATCLETYLCGLSTSRVDGKRPLGTSPYTGSRGFRSAAKDLFSKHPMRGNRRNHR